MCVRIGAITFIPPFRRVTPVIHLPLLQKTNGMKNLANEAIKYFNEIHERPCSPNTPIAVAIVKRAGMGNEINKILIAYVYFFMKS